MSSLLFNFCSWHISSPVSEGIWKASYAICEQTLPFNVPIFMTIASHENTFIIVTWAMEVQALCPLPRLSAGSAALETDCFPSPFVLVFLLLGYCFLLLLVDSALYPRFARGGEFGIDVQVSTAGSMWRSGLFEVLFSNNDLVHLVNSDLVNSEL